MTLIRAGNAAHFNSHSKAGHTFLHSQFKIDIKYMLFYKQRYFFNSVSVLLDVFMNWFSHVAQMLLKT